MGIINVEGIGPIEIKGDAPDEQESQAIGEIVKSTPKSDQQTVAETDSFIGSPSFKRLLLEAGLAIGGSCSIWWFSITTWISCKRCDA
jgi:hypothetical protein